MMEASKQVLMVAYFFPPLSGSGVFRSIKFAKYLPLFGWQPTVIATDQAPLWWNYMDTTQVAEIPKGMDVIRIPDRLQTGRASGVTDEKLQKTLRFLFGVLQHSKEATEIFQSLVQTKDGIRALFSFPCGALAWAHDAVCHIETSIDIRKFQAVYTTSGPYSSHLIGFFLKKKYGIPWVADYRDPWTGNAYRQQDESSPMDRLLFLLESVLLHSADCSISTAEGIAADWVERFHVKKEKLASITNGYDEDDFADFPSRKTHTGKFTINYSGLLYMRERGIRPILEALRQLVDEKLMEPEHLSFRFVGRASEDPTVLAAQYGLESVMECARGYIPHHEAIAANVEADLLLLLVGDEEKFRTVHTGKIFEQLRAGTPILAIAPKDGVVDRILRESGQGKAVRSTQIPEIKQMILQEYRRWQAGEKSDILNLPVIQRFERKCLTQQLAAVFDGILAEDALGGMKVLS